MPNATLLPAFIKPMILMNPSELSKTQQTILSLTAILVTIAYFGLNMFPWAGGIFIPVSCILILTFFYKQVFANIRQNSVTFIAVLLLTLITIAMFYSSASWHLRIFTLKHYLPLLYIPMLMVLFQKNQRFSKVALHAFCLGCFFYMLLCIINYFDILPIAKWVHRQPIDMYLFERANYAFALTTCLALQFTFSKTMPIKIRACYGFVALFMLWSLLFVSTVRTDYVLALLAVIIFACQHLRKLNVKWTVFVGLICILAVFTTYHISSHLKQGMNRIAHGIVAYKHGNPDTSSGLRLAFSHNSLKLIKHKPIFGYGTGDFSRIYASHHFIGLAGTPTTLDSRLDQPHNQYTYLMVEQGAVGTILFITLLIIAFKQSYRLPEAYKQLSQAVILLLAANSLFMSTLFYHNTAYTFGALLALCLAQQSQKQEAI
jgi:O-antigen ligase